MNRRSMFLTLLASFFSLSCNTDLSGLTAITVEPSFVCLGSTEEYQFRATGVFEDGSTREITSELDWLSVDESLAYFRADSWLKAREGVHGYLGVTGSFAGNEDTFAVSDTVTVLVVEDAASCDKLDGLVSIAIVPGNPVLSGTTPYLPSVIGTYWDSSTQDVTELAEWMVSDETIAEFGSDGIVPKEIGCTAVRASVFDVQSLSFSRSTRTTVLVSDFTNTSGIESFVVGPEGATLDLELAEEVDFEATATFGDSTTGDLVSTVSWESSDPLVAPISSFGRVTAESIGTTTITAVCDVFSDSTDVSVETCIPGGVAASGAYYIPSPPAHIKVYFGSTEEATSYNLYYATAPGVTVETGTKIEGVTSPYSHMVSPLPATYYYVVTAVNACGESAASNEVSAEVI